ICALINLNAARCFLTFFTFPGGRVYSNVPACSSVTNKRAPSGRSTNERTTSFIHLGFHAVERLGEDSQRRVTPVVLSRLGRAVEHTEYEQGNIGERLGRPHPRGGHL